MCKVLEAPPKLYLRGPRFPRRSGSKDNNFLETSLQSSQPNAKHRILGWKGENFEMIWAVEGVHFLNYWRSTNQKQTSRLLYFCILCTVLRLHIRQRPHGSYPTIVSVVAVRTRPEAQPDKEGRNIKYHDFITYFHCGMLCLPNSVWLLYAVRLLLESWASQRNRNNRASINK